MAIYNVYPMVIGQCDSPEPRIFYLGDPEKTVPTVFLFWLLKSDKKIVLVDTGFSCEFCAKFMPDVVQKPKQHPLKQLMEFGIKPEDIDIIVVTHAHFDHLSEIVHKYRNAQIYIQRSEYEFVTNPPHPWFAEFVDQETIHALAEQGTPRFNLLDGDSQITDGISTIMTPGHTLGHQSVLVDTKNSKVCIAGDIVFFYRNLDEDIGPGFNCNLIDALLSLRKLRELREKGVTILPGHDPAIFEHYSQMPIL
jgi:glyoxylase-like metal-dependent hydrolase (beta-lactamase superfamily II)